jgi:uncharacterized protein (DUF1330 family)
MQSRALQLAERALERSGPASRGWLAAIAIVWMLLLAACSPKMSKPTAEQVERPAYLIVQATITDRARFGGYVGALPPVYAKYGGEYLAVAPAATVLRTGGQKSPTQSIVISKWPNMAALREFWNSGEYAEVKRLREGTGEFLVLAMTESAPDQALSDMPSTPVEQGPGPFGYGLQQGPELDKVATQELAETAYLVLREQKAFYVFGGPIELVLEGEPKFPALWLTRFDSMDAAKGYYTSNGFAANIAPEYGPADLTQIDVFAGVP